MSDKDDSKYEHATFAAGCFWGMESIFKQVKGVVETTVGYTGGTYTNPTYRDVCTGITGHAEAVMVKYDPKIVSYEELLTIFWESAQSDYAEPPGTGCWYSIPLCDLLQRRSSEEGCREVQRGL